MKKTVISIIGITLMLFAFTACQPRYIFVPHVHAFGEWTIIKEATCTDEGVKTRTCKLCSETETKIIEALGHDFDAVTNTCTRCGTVRQVISAEDDFLTATQKDGDVLIILQEDITIEIAPHPTNDKSVFGNDKTESIVVDGNGHTITFNNTDSDWNAIYTTNEDAVLTIKNATIDNSGHNADGGTWNGHDINFNCNVVLDNVTANNAIALGGKTATIKNTTISDADCTSDAYMLWIQANGQTVTVEDCIINGKSSTGHNNRAIKIADEYFKTPFYDKGKEEPGHVILNVSGTTFSSDSKAAVLVTNTAGATINWGKGNDISGVKADTVNAVWNDGDRASYMDLVKVYGCTMKLEP